MKITKSILTFILSFIFSLSTARFLSAEDPAPSVPRLEKLLIKKAPVQALVNNAQFEALKRAASRGEQDFIPEIPNFKGLSQFNIPVAEPLDVITLFNQALATHNFVKIIDLLEEGLDIDAKDSDGRTALMNATLANDIDFFKHLVDFDADPNEQDNQGKSVISYVILYGNNAMLKYLFKYPVIMLNSGDKVGMTPLMYAVEKQQPAIIRFLIKKGANTNIQDKEGNTALHHAIVKNNVGIVKSLLALNADPLIQNNNKQLPLDLAQHLKNKEIIAELNKAIPAYISAKNYTDFLRALKNKTYKELERLLPLLPPDINQKDTSGKTYLIYAVIARNKSVIEELLARGADPRVADNQGKTSFDYALDDPEILKLLEEAKSQHIKIDFERTEALINAISTGNLQQMQDYLNAGAQVNLKIIGLEYPLIYAIINNNTPVAQLLLTAGANPNVALSNTPHNALGLIAAHNADNAALARALIDAGVDLNAQDDEGSTPLLIAIARNHVNVAKELIKAKADPNIAAHDGYTSLMYAIHYENPDLVRELLALGANPLDEFQGTTALEYAHTKENREIINILSSHNTLKNLPEDIII